MLKPLKMPSELSLSIPESTRMVGQEVSQCLMGRPRRH